MSGSRLAMSGQSWLGGVRREAWVLCLRTREQFLDSEYLDARVSVVGVVFGNVDAGRGRLLRHGARGLIQGDEQADPRPPCHDCDYPEWLTSQFRYSPAASPAALSTSPSALSRCVNRGSVATSQRQRRILSSIQVAEASPPFA